MLNRYTLLATAWFAASLYVLFFKTVTHQPPPFAHFDKVAHGGLFFGQTWLAGKIWLQANQAVPWRAVVTVLLLWAGLSELLQAFLTTDRHGDVWDAAADALGVAAAVYFLKHSEYGQRLS